jgi:hypothetical protein
MLRLVFSLDIYITGVVLAVGKKARPQNKKITGQRGSAVPTSSRALNI